MTRVRNGVCGLNIKKVKIFRLFRSGFTRKFLDSFFFVRGFGTGNSPIYIVSYFLVKNTFSWWFHPSTVEYLLMALSKHRLLILFLHPAKCSVWRRWHNYSWKLPSVPMASDVPQSPWWWFQSFQTFYEIMIEREKWTDNRKIDKNTFLCYVKPSH